MTSSVATGPDIRDGRGIRRPIGTVPARTGAALLIALLTATGCAGPGTEPTGEPTAGSGGAFPRTVTHAMGSTEIAAEPTRIVALDQTFVDAALALDTPVLAFTDIRGRTGGPPTYLAGPLDRLAPDARSVGELANPNLEQIAALKPDLIVSAKVRHEAIYDELNRIAPTVFDPASEKKPR
ncbi:MAG: ABC transporter substrate-binding protein [Pseudonocardiales bacterium]